MKKIIFLTLTIFLLMTSCPDLTTPKGRLNPADENYEPELDPENELPSAVLNQEDITLGNGGSITLTVTASDPEEYALTFEWYVNEQLQAGETETSFLFTAAPAAETVYTITVKVSDGRHTIEVTVQVTVQAPGANSAPVVSIVESDQALLNGQSLTLTTDSSDPDGNIISYRWFINDEEQTGAGSDTFTVMFEPSTEAAYTVKVEASDSLLTDEDTIELTVAAPPMIEYSDGGIWIELPPPDNKAIDLAVLGGIIYTLGHDNSVWYLNGGWQWGGYSTPANGIALAFIDSVPCVYTSEADIFHKEGASWIPHVSGTPSDGISITAMDSTLYLLGDDTLQYWDGSWVPLTVPPGAVSIASENNTLILLMNDLDIQQLDGTWSSTGLTAPAGSFALSGDDDRYIILKK